MSQENVEIVRQMLDAFNRDDVDSVVAAFDEQCELHEPPEMPDAPARGFRGHDGIRKWMTNLRETASVHFEPIDFASSGETVFGEWASRGLGQASGVPLEWSSFAVLRIGDGKIVHAQGFLTRAEALEAAGLSE